MPNKHLNVINWYK